MYSVEGCEAGLLLAGVCYPRVLGLSARFTSAFFREETVSWWLRGREEWLISTSLVAGSVICSVTIVAELTFFLS
jgi:hypothetical protein